MSAAAVRLPRICRMRVATTATTTASTTTTVNGVQGKCGVVNIGLDLIDVHIGRNVRRQKWDDVRSGHRGQGTRFVGMRVEARARSDKTKTTHGVPYRTSVLLGL